MAGIVWPLVIAFLLVVPFWKILPRYGIPRWVAILCALPLVAIGCLWLIAFKSDLDGSSAS